jgi:hypothetical protein
MKTSAFLELLSKHLEGQVIDMDSLVESIEKAKQEEEKVDSGVTSATCSPVIVAKSMVLVCAVNN